VQNYRLSFKDKLADIQDAIGQDDSAQMKSLMHKLQEAKPFIVETQKCKGQLHTIGSLC
jgi:hypothetical protein